jgi:hypothetical protein
MGVPWLRRQRTGVHQLLPPRHRLHTHLDKTVLGLAVGEEADGFDSLVAVFLRQSAGLFEAIGLRDDVAGLGNGMLDTQN